MTAAAVTFALGAGDKRRLLIDCEDGTYRELVATVVMPYAATVNLRTETGDPLCLYRRQILAASYPDEPIPADDPVRHCKQGHRYRFVHYGPDGWAVETVGVLHMAVPQMAFVDVGDVTLLPIARNSILCAREAPA